MTTTTDYTPPEHMAPAEDGFLVAFEMYATARRRWQEAGKPRGLVDPHPTFRAMAETMWAIGGLHRGWVTANQLRDVDPNGLDPVLYDHMPEEEEVVDLTATAKQWIDWVRENYVPQVREFALENGLPWREDDR